MKKQFVKPELKIIAMETSSICASSDGVEAGRLSVYRIQSDQW